MGSPVNASRCERQVSSRCETLLAWLRKYATDRIDSRLMDERRCIPPYVVLDFGNTGLMGLHLGQDYGGADFCWVDSLSVYEQVGAIDLTLAAFLGVHNILGTIPLRDHGTTAAKSRYLPALATGRILGCFALTEESAGSDPRSIQASATPADDRLLLNGHKIWVGSGCWSSVTNTIVKEYDRSGRLIGASAFVLSSSAKGLRQGEEALTMGVRAMVQNSIYLTDVSASDEDRLSVAGAGMAVAQQAMNFGRLGIAATCIGAMKRCLTSLHRYGRRRHISTGFLSDNALYSTRLSDMIVAVEAIDALVYKIGWMLDFQLTVPEHLYACCKILGTEYLWKCVDTTMQFMGGRGYIESNIVPQLFRDARLFRIFEGPTETLLAYVGTAMLSGQPDMEAFVSELSPAAAAALGSELASIKEWQQTGISQIDSVRLKAQSAGEITCAALVWAAWDSQDTVAMHGEREAAIQWARYNFTKIVSDGNHRLASLPDANAIKTMEARVDAYAGLVGSEGRAHISVDPYMDILLRTEVSETSLSQSRVRSVEFSATQQRAAFGREEEIEEWLSELIASRKQLSDSMIGTDVPFSDFGVDSLDAVLMVESIEEYLGLTLEPTVLWNYPTIHALANFLASELSTLHCHQIRHE
jgi:alkylation response protein AidB-like acyl-CoA dehydrogenase/acyl carrier protein